MKLARKSAGESASGEQTSEIEGNDVHELSLAFDLVERAEEIARGQNAKRVRSVEVAIGELSGIDRESFKFVFPEAARDSLLAEAQLVVVDRPDRDFQFLSMEIEDV